VPLTHLGHLQNVHKTLRVEVTSVHNSVSNFHKTGTEVLHKTLRYGAVVFLKELFTAVIYACIYTRYSFTSVIV
jgi:hypothetical protein